MHCAHLPSCTGCAAVFPPPDAESQLCRWAGEQTIVCRAATEKSSLYLEEWASLVVTEFYMTCCDLDLSLDMSAAVLFNDTLPALKQVLTESDSHIHYCTVS